MHFGGFVSVYACMRVCACVYVGVHVCMWVCMRTHIIQASKMPKLYITLCISSSPLNVYNLTLNVLII